MEQATIKGLLINMAILAQADGAVDPLERNFVKGFLKKVRVSNAEANRWLAEAQSEGLKFQPVPERKQALDLLKLMVGVAAADGKLEEKETATLVWMAKACGISQEETTALVKDYWKRDVFAEVLARPSPKPTEQGAELRVTLIADGFAKVEDLVTGNPSVRFDRHKLDEVLSGAVRPEAIVLHAQEKREDSIGTAKAVKNACPNAKIVVVVRRDQAFQIGYLMEQGIHRCLVEPIFPNEISQVLREKSL